MSAPETAAGQYARWTARLASLDRDALEHEARGFAMTASMRRERSETVTRSWQRSVEDGMRALRRVRDLLDVHAKTIKMDDLRIALAECCERCGADPDEQKRIWRGDVVCARCHDEGVKREAEMAAEAEAR